MVAICNHATQIMFMIMISKSLLILTHNQSIMVGMTKDPDSVKTLLSLHLIQKMEKSFCISLDLMAMVGKHTK